MLLPVTLYGDPVLKRKADEIAADYPNLKDMIKNMFQTMYAASGVGIAAPQVGVSIRVFVVDTMQLD
ncbi:MAG TPA: peptide deformylase, partial [Chitinophagales bacterium]|nr:peptide deformylase [Chitinophagales bacterium]